MKDTITLKKYKKTYNNKLVFAILFLLIGISLINLSNNIENLFKSNNKNFSGDKDVRRIEVIGICMLFISGAFFYFKLKQYEKDNWIAIKLTGELIQEGGKDGIKNI